MSLPRLRMFAGPNGSGKSTIKSVLPDNLLGVYLNPDEIQKGIEEELKCDPMPLWFPNYVWNKITV